MFCVTVCCVQGQHVECVFMNSLLLLLQMHYNAKNIMENFFC